MKFTPEVIAALNVLRHAAENDFERHRLDVLERDLTSPPTVEVIDNTHQKFNGIMFTIDKFGHYQYKFPVHRAVWSYYHGEIPVGDYEIHHIDENKANNDISNLRLLTKSEHRKIHKIKKIEKICPICNEKFYVLPFRASQKYCSRGCANIGLQNSLKLNYLRKTCPVCHKKFLVPPSQNSQIYCSRSCASIGKKQSHVPIKKFCPICGKEFTPANKKVICCSLSCAQKLVWKNRHKKETALICHFCGKKFTASHNSKKRKYCSANCYHESRRSQKQK